MERMKIDIKLKKKIIIYDIKYKVQVDNFDQSQVTNEHITCNPKKKNAYNPNLNAGVQSSKIKNKK